jgi:hypothetical protein
VPQLHSVLLTPVTEHLARQFRTVVAMDRLGKTRLGLQEVSLR